MAYCGMPDEAAKPWGTRGLGSCFGKWCILESKGASGILAN